ncbi:MAG: FAD-binding protein [Planctomycetota bacterium]|nr:FAD-binding protein [Planctomycetota bacterium]
MAETLTVKCGRGRKLAVPIYRAHTLVVGSGAAGLNAALQLRRCGVEDVMIVTEGLRLGTSINTGSDKQTYYKISLYGADADSPLLMAETYMAGGSMHGDLALAEAATSAQAFLHLVNLGVPFPRDRYGQFVGYKTDHDPRQRATSVGPYTSRDMCLALIREVKAQRIPVREKRLAITLLTLGEGEEKRAAGILALDSAAQLEAYMAENIVFAVGGPGGLYEASVYPEVHNGAIGVALLAGAKAQSLPESQYGLASTQFRWNVSGTYMQVIPRFVSVAADGNGAPVEFLRPYFRDAGEMNSLVFLKGYQWPFDARKAAGGSSLIDILVYIETAVRGRRVFLDFRANPEGFSFDALSGEAQNYLRRSEALQETPLKRLAKMNPAAIQLYRDHGIDISREPLAIAVCAQHNNGGLAANCWWESLNIRHLFPAGEVNGSHGVYRPGGSALNSGQVGGFRAAAFISNRYAKWTLTLSAFRRAAAAAAAAAAEQRELFARGSLNWRQELAELRLRMSRFGAHIRPAREIAQATADARAQWRRIAAPAGGSAPCRPADIWRCFIVRQLCYTHFVYLDAIRFMIESGVGSRGSAIVLDERGTLPHPRLASEWRFQAEDQAFRERVLETLPQGETLSHCWVPRRPLPACDAWFENAWAAYREGKIYLPT